MKAMLSNGVRGAGILAAFSLVFTALMAGSYSLTQEIVQKNEEQARSQLIAQTLPAGSYDNNLLANSRKLSQEDSRRLGNDKPASVYLAKKEGKIVAAVFEAIAPDGYAGKIQLLVAVASGGEVLGVRVLSHQETPGLGDYIDAAKSNWIRQFDGKSLASTEIERWKVRKDGGVFDSNAGATISPRAVVNTVKKTLAYVAENRATIFE